MDCSPPGFSVHEILWARILEWVAISFSRGSSRPRDQIWVSYISCLGRQVLYHTSMATQDKDKVWKKCKETDLASCLDPTSCLPLFSYTFIFPCPSPTLSLIPFLFSRALSPTWWLQFHQPNVNLHLWAYSLSPVWLFATSWTAPRQAPLSMRFLQARILEWVAMLSSRGSSQSRDRTHISCTAGGFFTSWAIREAQSFEPKRE